MNVKLLFQEISEKKQIQRQIDSNAIFTIETPELYKGGLLNWDESYCLRHLATGKYLKQVAKKVCLKHNKICEDHDVEKNQFKVAQKVCLMHDDKKDQFEFKIKKTLLSTDKQSIQINIQNNQYMKIQNRDTKNYIGVQKNKDDDQNHKPKLSLQCKGFLM